MSRIEYLSKLTSCIGVSDHSNPDECFNIIPAASSLLGADVIEKHFTILPKDKTKDGPVSTNPEQFRELSYLFKTSNEEQTEYLKSKNIKVKDLLGDPLRELSDTELLNRDYYQGRYLNSKNDGSFFYNWERV